LVESSETGVDGSTIERAGLISHTADAQRRPRRLEAKPLAEATEWLERYREFWEATFLRIDDLLEEVKAKEKEAARTKKREGRK